jgi:hypothetical protein
VLFLNLIDKISISETHAELIFDFIKLIIPDNNIEVSYYKFKKLFEHKLSKEIRLCNLCEEKLILKNCSNEFCASQQKTNTKKNTKTTSKLIICNIEEQIKKIISKNYDKMLEYKSKNSL